jgi:hypothetical protein
MEQLAIRAESKTKVRKAGVIVNIHHTYIYIYIYIYSFGRLRTVGVHDDHQSNQHGIWLCNETAFLCLVISVYLFCSYFVFWLFFFFFLFIYLFIFFEADGLSSCGIKGRLDGDSKKVWIHKEILRKGFDTKDALPLSNIRCYTRLIN